MPPVYVLTDGDGERIRGEVYDDPDAAIDARARLLGQDDYDRDAEVTVEVQDDRPDEKTDGYEYRLMGMAETGWRCTEWEDYETVLEKYPKARDSWSGIALERREPGEDTTIERKPRPDVEQWKPVTEDMTHVKGEEVGSA
ncbi:hypothetical protein [Natrinema versiforme]|uniref:Uncharacterized protein n=1 Tax=Natrinema versiforme JCM 10478 TaxID=1227496 RepID=L9Y7G7_9EURY|nr:hypothetical protein [Natrinema versiforme]ELY68883.1 hypothetical protein C489_05938 [Natrinema versiforme JCM 10478]